MCTWKYELFKCGHKYNYQRVKYCHDPARCQHPTGIPEYIDRWCEACHPIRKAGTGVVSNMSCAMLQQQPQQNISNFTMEPIIPPTSVPRSSHNHSHNHSHSHSHSHNHSSTSGSSKSGSRRAPADGYSDKSYRPKNFSTGSDNGGGSNTSTSRSQHSRRKTAENLASLPTSASVNYTSTSMGSGSGAVDDLNGRYSPSMSGRLSPSISSMNVMVEPDRNFVWRSNPTSSPW
ncbi:uncharacterized protein SAPINGB_P003533 [Magnusiomyces paraingens]|uniref:Uncharacterized protein n=1 Tax=Magnusiomyces paraingens TaxID=2606893 RepID=A0A5E8BV93_9ASCO|nr:uncharacterized protein SAPINGB_P003533 [Saprochaete ingens]VVT53357.1 unnamed protein product [Saprochaete ingens]